MIYAIGDIHGQNFMLQTALDYLHDHLLHANDTVVFLGDYIDRGLQSKDVLETLRAFQSVHEKTVFLRGNHEELFLCAYGYDADCEAAWFASGGSETLASYGAYRSRTWRNSIPAKDIDFIINTQIEYIGNYFHFVHAGLPPNLEDYDQDSADYERLWIRDEFIDSHHDFGKVVVFGHTPQQSMEPLVMLNKVGLDTAAAFGGLLSVAGFDDSQPVTGCPTFTLFQVDQDGTILVTETEDEAPIFAEATVAA